MFSFKDILLLIKDVTRIKDQISYLPGPGEFLSNNFGDLDDSYSGNYSEVTFLKGTKNQIDNYVGNLGQVAIDVENNDLYLMNGNGSIGGKKVGFGNSISESLNIQITSDEWTLDGLYYFKVLNHNLNITLEEFDIKFFKASTNILLEYEYVDVNNIKVYSDQQVTINAIIKSFKANSNMITSFDIIQSDWNDDALHSYTLNHNLNISIENIDVKFYKENTNVLLSYEFIDNNNIKIYSDEKVSIKAVIRKV